MNGGGGGEPCIILRYLYVRNLLFILLAAPDSHEVPSLSYTLDVWI